MRTTRIILMLVALCFVAALAAYAEPFRSDAEGYRYGYDQGYQHGLDDKNVNLEFNYRREFPSGESYYSYVNTSFRDGYSDGYTDGYNGRTRHEEAPEYSNEDRSRTERGYYVPRSQDGVAVFTDEKFDGPSREFGIGRYPDLDGDWNDSIESVQIIGPVRVILFDKSNFRGQRLIIEQDEANLDHLNFGGKAASMIVEPLR